MDWSDLAHELLAAIAATLDELPDLHRFRSVCSSWRSAAHSVAPPPQRPWLLLPSDPSLPSLRLFSLSEDRVYTLPLPQARGCHLFGSPSGWLLAVDASSLSARLLNPFSGDSIHLPPLESGSSFCSAGVATLVWDYSPSGVMLACPTGFGLFFSRPGNMPWKPIDALAASTVISITYHDGKFFLLEEGTCQTTVVDAAKLAVVGTIPPPPIEYPLEAHLAVSDGELLLLAKSSWMYLLDGHGLQSSRIFRADPHCEESGWAEETGIGDRVLFVDCYHGFSFDANRFGGLKGNCVYSAGSTSEGALSAFAIISLLSLDDRNCKQLDCQLNRFPVSWRERGAAPSWIIPSLCQHKIDPFF